jgi:hypothetical protein
LGRVLKTDIDKKLGEDMKFQFVLNWLFLFLCNLALITTGVVLYNQFRARQLLTLVSTAVLFLVRGGR